MERLKIIDFNPYSTVAAEILKYSKRLVVLTGAGISTSSGIADFRSPQGLWQEYDPSIYVNYDTFVKDPSYYWKVERRVIDSFIKAKPNAAHKALVKLEKIKKKQSYGELQAIITQNIDNLHQNAGSKVPIIELHGNMNRAKCLECKKEVSRKYINKILKNTKDIPTCPYCKGKIKTDMTLFNENLVNERIIEARRLANQCDAMLILGTSLEVYPANQLPVMAKMNNAKLICMNNEPTAKDKYFRIKLIGDLTDTLPNLIKQIK